MVNNFCSVPLWKCSARLSAVAMGNEKADLVITNARLINVCTREIIEGAQVAVACGRIAMVGDCSKCIGENTKIVDAENNYLAPAFLDGHIHVESSMLSVGEYAKVTMPHGTAGIFMDPHEICNVLGLDGVKYMLEDAKRAPLKTMLTTPSCVPAVPGFEDTGATIGPEDIAETMKWDECVGLGEMMNFPGIIYSDERTHAIVGETLKAGKTVTGHYSVPETENGLNAYIAAGVRCCHESTREIDALAKMRLGMYAMFREGSAWHDLKELAPAITKHNVDSRYACLISDDTHPHTLKKYGHLDHIVKRAIEEGIDPLTAIQMATINVAQCFSLDQELGSITPSKCADMVIISDLNECKVEKTFIDGKLVAENGKTVVEIKDYVYPAKAINTVHMAKITEDDLKVKAEGVSADVRAIEIIPARTTTYERIVNMPIENGEIKSDVKNDLLKMAVFERHNNTGKHAFGFVKGFGIKSGALAQTVAHDAHNLSVIGTNDKDMVIAVNALIECGGGLVAVKDGKIIGKVPLPIAGLISDKSLEETDALVSTLENAWKEVGCKHPSPFMTMGIIPLACLPELRLTDRGLVDCRTFKFVDLIVESHK